jgi:hypothetical protein
VIHVGMGDSDGGKEMRWMGTPAETSTPSLAGVEKSRDGASSAGCIDARSTGRVAGWDTR